MRILYLHQYFVRPDMSGGTRSYDLAKQLADAGHDVQMITTWREPDAPSDGWFQERVDGFDVHWLPISYNNKMGFHQRVKAFLEFAWKCGSKAIELGGDVVFATSTPLTIAIPAVRASKRLKVPMVFEVRDLWPEVPIATGAIKNPVLKVVARRLELYAYRHADRVVALSQGMANGVSRTGYPESHITVIPNISNIQRFDVPKEAADPFFQQHPKFRDRPLILYAGALGDVNNVGFLVEMAGALKDHPQSPNFLIVGDGRQKEMLFSRAKELAVLDQNLFFLPPVSKSEMPSLFAAATVSAVPAINIPELAHTSQNKFFDSLAAGKPILIEFPSWLKDLVQEHQAGVVVPPTDPNTAGKMLVEFLADQQQVESAAKASKKLAEQEFEVNLLGNKLISVMESVASHA